MDLTKYVSKPIFKRYITSIILLISIGLSSIANGQDEPNSKANIAKTSNKIGEGLVYNDEVKKLHLPDLASIYI